MAKNIKLIENVLHSAFEQQREYSLFPSHLGEVFLVPAKVGLIVELFWVVEVATSSSWQDDI